MTKQFKKQEFKGLYVSFEGNEGSGKDTLISKLIPWLETLKIPNFLIREPGGVPVSEEIRKILVSFKGKMNPKTELFLFSACRSQNNEDVVIPHLEKGDIVLSNRTFDASSVYQGYAGGLGFDYANQVNRLAVGGCIPDFTFLLLVAVEVGLERVRKHDRVESAQGKVDRIEARGLKYHEKVLEGYKILAQNNSRFITIDTTEIDQNEVFEITKKIFTSKILSAWRKRNKLNYQS